MQNQFFEAGLGRLLRTAGATSANKPNDDTTIANNEYSESFAGHDCLEIVLGLVFAAAATGDFIVQRSSDPAFATSETHETVTVTASLFYSWAAGETLTGYYRVRNTTGQTVSIYLNKRIA